MEIKKEFLETVLKPIQEALYMIEDGTIKNNEMYDYIKEHGNLEYTPDCIHNCFYMFDFLKKDGTFWSIEELEKIDEDNDYFQV